MQKKHSSQYLQKHHQQNEKPIVISSSSSWCDASSARRYYSTVPRHHISWAAFRLTFLYSSGIKILKVLACSGKNAYFCIEMSWKGSISRMSDECLMTLETVFSFYIVYQAVMRKFTLAGKSITMFLRLASSNKRQSRAKTPRGMGCETPKDYLPFYKCTRWTNQVTMMV